MPNFKFASLAILELLAFNAQKIKGHVTTIPPPFHEFFSGVMWELWFQTIFDLKVADKHTSTEIYAK